MKLSNGENKQALSCYDLSIMQIIGQYFTERGFVGLTDKISEQTGVCMELPDAALLRQSIILGHWESCDIALKRIVEHQKSVGQSLDETKVKKIKHVIGVQKYLELLELGKKTDALKVLRSDITASGISDPLKIRELSAYLRLGF